MDKLTFEGLFCDIAQCRELAAADMEPVRRGWWLYEPKIGSKTPYKCSLPDCGASYSKKSFRCPTCGARMDNG